MLLSPLHFIYSPVPLIHKELCWIWNMITQRKNPYLMPPHVFCILYIIPYTMNMWKCLTSDDKLWLYNRRWVHVHACAYMYGGPPSTRTPPTNGPPSPKGGNPKISKNSISLELIKIDLIQFCLNIWNLLSYPTWDGCMVGWMCGLMGGVMSNI